MADAKYYRHKDIEWGYLVKIEDYRMSLVFPDGREEPMTMCPLEVAEQIVYSVHGGGWVETPPYEMEPPARTEQEAGRPPRTGKRKLRMM